MLYNRGTLLARRQLIEQDWGRARFEGETGSPRCVEAEIYGSWQRSRRAVPPARSAAPLDDEAGAAREWRASPLCTASAACTDELATVAAEGGLVAAVSDAGGRLVWTSAGRVMRRRAERVHFVPGGRWDETSVGTNALALAIHLKRPATVFSAEHFVAAVHDWVCYAAPIVEPGTGRVAGVVDLSTTWDKHNPLGLAAVASFAQRIAARLPQGCGAGLDIRALGEACVLFRGRRLPLSPRQVEILCLLALNPEGLTLDALHAQLYEASAVQPATLKAEVSHLRNVLDGAIASRPYRLGIPCRADFLAVHQALAEGRVDAALAACGGPLLPRSEAPGIREWRHYLEAAIARAIGRSRDADSLWGYAQRSRDDAALEQLLRLLPADDPRRALACARLEALA